MEGNADWKFWLLIVTVFLVFFHKLIYAVGVEIVNWVKRLFKK